MKKGDFIEIQWIDSVSTYNVWQDLEGFDFESHDRSMLYKSTGYFLKKTPVATYLCMSMRNHAECGGENIGRLFAIPNVAISSIKKVKIG